MRSSSRAASPESVERSCTGSPGIDGGWTGTFQQVWAYDRGLLTYGHEIATGFGELAGWQLRATLSEAFDGTITEIDEVFVPGG